MVKKRVDVPKAPVLGPRLQEARQERRLTLDKLAALSGISKSMLSQIERGHANPTFATLWNIAHALNLDIGLLVADVSAGGEEAGQGVEIMRAHFTPTLQSADGRCVLQIFSPVETAAEVEWYQLQMDKEGCLGSEPHAAGTVEHLTCLKGVIEVKCGAKTQRLTKGDTARYKGDQAHIIENVGNSKATALMVVQYRS